MANDDLLKYFIKQSNERFDSIESKLDKLISFRWMLIGASVGISGIVSVVFQVVMAIAGAK